MLLLYLSGFPPFIFAEIYFIVSQYSIALNSHSLGLDTCAVNDGSPSHKGSLLCADDTNCELVSLEAVNVELNMSTITKVVHNFALNSATVCNISPS